MEIDSIQALGEKYGMKFQDQMHFNEMGIDFRVAFAQDIHGDAWILRIPRRAHLGTQISEEKRILELVAPHLSVQVPQWEVAEPDLVAYRLLDGRPALTFDAETYDVQWYMPADSPHYAPTLAKVLTELHAIPEDLILNKQLKILSPEASRKEIADRIQTVKSGLGISEVLYKRYMDWVETDKLWPNFTRLVHGDLYAGHVLTTVEGRVSGIIDWTTAQVNDIAIDFSGHMQVFGESGLRELIKEYEQRGGQTWDYLFEQALERAAASPLAYGHFALTTGDEQHIQGAKAQLGLS